MFKFNWFSGNTYFGSENVKLSSTGETFFKLGNLWVGDNNKTILDTGKTQMNLNTGTMSTFGDPFGEDK